MNWQDKTVSLVENIAKPRNTLKQPHQNFKQRNFKEIKYVWGMTIKCMTTLKCNQLCLPNTVHKHSSNPRSYQGDTVLIKQFMSLLVFVEWRLEEPSLSLDRTLHLWKYHIALHTQNINVFEQRAFMQNV